jgi:hypothetical protein
MSLAFDGLVLDTDGDLLASAGDLV